MKITAAIRDQRDSFQVQGDKQNHRFARKLSNLCWVHAVNLFGPFYLLCLPAFQCTGQRSVNGIFNFERTSVNVLSPKNNTRLRHEWISHEFLFCVRIFDISISSLAKFRTRIEFLPEDQSWIINYCRRFRRWSSLGVIWVLIYHFVKVDSTLNCSWVEQN